MSEYRIEAYAYSETAGDGTATCKYADAQTLGVHEMADYFARPAVPTAFLDLLAFWAADFTASAGAGHYAITYSATTGRVTIATTNAVNFKPIMPANVAAFLGFSPQTFVAAQSFVGDVAPLGILTPLGLDLDLRADAPQIAAGNYRHGRSYPIVFGNHKLIRGVLLLRDNEMALKSASYLSGRVRISTLAAGLATAYGVGHLDGWFDAQLVDWGKPEPFSTSAGRRVPVVFAVAR